MLVVGRTIAIVIAVGLLGYILVAAAIYGGDVDWRVLLLLASVPVGIGFSFWTYLDSAREVRGRSGSGDFPGPPVERAVTDGDHRRQL
ncbi:MULTISPECIES: hypothetical protein [unclassified Aureimonas]|uniref:hypothetical protein n=1 Tax=unclassified Aureimonas TaxID=2615206 RepID=UPI0006F44A54|nr:MULTISPECIES: hypothetical protein [unclassified Aureimonas]KQT52115.1 hypothetical protein ASG62_15740 [Aureimonas sp. Leaf427]KQT70651.1 hypothetical protein ASG54_22210 [Aureimonas sp. Leaf460]